MLPASSTFLSDVLNGLAAPRKNVPAKYFYDAEGSRLFEEICKLSVYYPTRTEIALLKTIAPSIAEFIPEGAALIEFGSGASVKTRQLLDAAPGIGVYVPIDISPDALDQAAASLGASYPCLPVEPVVADFTAMTALPPAIASRPCVGFFPGSTIGNFTAPEIVTLLARTRHLLGARSSFIVGFDLQKDESTLVAAYNDPEGVTAAFNLNLLTRINRELSGDIPVNEFEHRAVWNAADGRIEMHLVSKKAQTVRAAGKAFRFEKGEHIHTENSHKFTIEGFKSLAALSGWHVSQCWVSAPSDPAFAVVLLQ